MACSVAEYPAWIYKNNKSNLFIANCYIKNIIGMGRTEDEAISNLQNSLNVIEHNEKVKIKPMYELKTSIV